MRHSGKMTVAVGVGVMAVVCHKKRISKRVLRPLYFNFKIKQEICLSGRGIEGKHLFKPFSHCSPGIESYPV